MLDTKYIYDLTETEMKLMAKMSYPEGLLYLIEASKRLRNKLSKASFMNRDDRRLLKIKDAIEFNNKRLHEIGYFDKKDTNDKQVQ